jgi:hypothetical protein
MYSDKYDLDELAGLVKQGERWAAAALREAMEPHLCRVVRRTLAEGEGRSVMQRRILNEARLLARRRPQAPGGEPAERLVRQVADRVCTALIDGLGRSGAPSVRLSETLCA